MRGLARNYQFEFVSRGINWSRSAGIGQGIRRRLQVSPITAPTWCASSTPARTTS